MMILIMVYFQEEDRWGGGVGDNRVSTEIRLQINLQFKLKIEGNKAIHQVTIWIKMCL